MLNQKQWIILGILIGSFFFYGGAEVLFGTYIATFSVKSLLKLSKQTGSEVFKKLRKLLSEMNHFTGQRGTQKTRFLFA